MSQKLKRTRRKKAAAGAGVHRRQELRFTTSAMYISPLAGLIGMAGCLLLGAGVFSLWFSETPADFAAYLVAAGGFGLAVALWIAPPERAVLVGDGGVAIELSKELVRIPWYAMKALSIRGDVVEIHSSGSSFSLSLGANSEAVAWALKEAAERRPELLDVESAAQAKLPAPSRADATEQLVSDDQVTGAACASSGTVIQLEDDARLCPGCAQIYHHSHVPPHCVTCQADLAGKVLKP